MPERLFEAKVNPIMITRRDSRAVTNVTPNEGAANTAPSGKLEKLEKRAERSGTNVPPNESAANTEPSGKLEKLEKNMGAIRLKREQKRC